LENLYTYKDTTIAASFKDADMKRGIVTGYFSRFGNVDADGDIIKPGAFAKTVKEQGPKSAQPRIKHLMNHNPSMPLGKILDLKEDSSGLLYESQVGSHSLGQDFIKMVESGLITEHSIGYKTIKRNQLQDYAGYQKNPSKGMFEITEAKLFEGSSLTAWGANPMTPLTGLKGAVDINNVIQQQAAIEKFCKDSTATDETIEMLLLHSKQLSQYILDMKANQPAKATDPDKWKGWVNKLQTT
jgi:HK97 family phage prohead protease